MTCGNHLLKGKLVDLPKPIVLSERIKSDSGVSLVIQAVIRRKVLFAARPTP